jgi:hypothetical protein
MQVRNAAIFTLCILVCLHGHTEAAEERHLFILSGQSNMSRMKAEEGFLPEAQKLLPDATIERIKVAAPGKPIRNWLAEWDEMAKAVDLDPDAIREGDQKSGSPYYDGIVSDLDYVVEGSEEWQYWSTLETEGMTDTAGECVVHSTMAVVFPGRGLHHLRPEFPENCP